MGFVLICGAGAVAGILSALKAGKSPGIGGFSVRDMQLMREKITTYAEIWANPVRP